MCNAGHSGLVAMALLLRGEMKFLWQHREEALQDLERVVDTSNISTEVICCYSNYGWTILSYIVKTYPKIGFYGFENMGVVLDSVY